MKKHNYVYTIVRQTPNENGVKKGYVGVHCTDNLDDGYFGSGSHLKNAVKKYGRDDFVKTIVADFETEEEAVAYETDLLHRMHKICGWWKLFSERFYNLKLNNSRGKVSFSDESRRKMSESQSGGKNYWLGKTRSEENVRKLREANLGKNHSESTRIKISKAKTGNKNGTFKGFTVGTSLENGRTIVFNGKKSMKARGFNSGGISQMLLGRYRQYKNFTFTRTKDPDVLQSLLDQNNFFDEESKIILEEFLRDS